MRMAIKHKSTSIFHSCPNFEHLPSVAKANDPIPEDEMRIKIYYSEQQAMDDGWKKT